MDEKATQGALTEAVFYILLSLLQPCHGYAVMQNVEQLTDGRVKLGAGTLYGALNTLLEKRWICPVESDGDCRKKEYVITSAGRTALQNELLRLEELVATGKQEWGNAPQ